jgi:exopolysaccharide production protein ExoY
MELLKSIIVGILSRLAAEELKAWSPTIVAKFASIAVQRLPTDQKERFTEEWDSDLSSIPGEVSKIIYAFDLIRAAGNISIQSKGSRRSLLDRSAKRLLDFAVAAIALITIFPVMLAISIVVKITSPGPIFFSEERIGKDGRRFLIRKFRTMYVNGQTILRQHLRNNPGAAEGWMKAGLIANDPRVTPIGRILRRLSLDELPQFWNVFNGEMSLVGPPPLRSIPHHEGTAAYDGAKPGITSIWSISQYDSDGRDGVDSDHNEKESFWSDIKTLIQTVLIVLRGSRRN